MIAARTINFVVNAKRKCSRHEEADKRRHEEKDETFRNRQTERTESDRREEIDKTWRNRETIRNRQARKDRQK